MQQSNSIKRHRCSNDAVEWQLIAETHRMAEALARRLQDIQFVLSEQEQRGLYSIIHQLSLACDMGYLADHAQSGRWAAQKGEQRLRELLGQIRQETERD